MKIFNLYTASIPIFIILISQLGLIQILNVNGQDETKSPFADFEYLVLSNRTGKSIFTFNSPTSFIQLQLNKVIQRYHIRDRRSVSLDFRTRLPHALLLYHGIKDRPANMHSYELYIMLDQGQLKVKHLFGDFQTTIIVGKGLNRGRWHHVNVVIDPHEQSIEAYVDQHNTSSVLDGLKEFPLYGYGSHQDKLDSIIFVGGLNASVPNLNISYIANTFIGCIRNVSLATSPLLTSDLEKLTDLVSSDYKNVVENCINKCYDRDQPCGLGSQCINHYDHVECDCFFSKYKGPTCYKADIPPLNLQGYSYVTFTMYEWMDRVHSDTNRISMHFSTFVDDSMLFYAAGEIPIHNHISVTITNGKLQVSIDTGDGQSISTIIGNSVIDGADHVFTITHNERNVEIKLDNFVEKFELTGNLYHFYFDPDIYIGGGGHILRNRQGLNSSNNFVGCLREVYFNAKSILWELNEKGHHARYHGDGDPNFSQCELQKNVPITIPFADSGFRISNPNIDELDLKFEFRSDDVFGTLAYSDIRTESDEGFWELKLANEGIQFFLYPSKGLQELNTGPILHVKFNKRNMWTLVSLKYSNGQVSLEADTDKQAKDIQEKLEENPFQFSPFITLGTSLLQPKQGFIGCMRKIIIGGRHIDSRQIVGSDDQIGDIAMDNCKYVDPCKRPEVCKHGGKCVIQPGDGEVSCDCSETGYTGRHCHFANFKRTCEELGLLGYKQSGVFKIDIDGNGPYPPVHVKCKFETGTNSSDEIKTIVEHNLANETDIWIKNDKERYDFKIELSYREFTPEMLMSLISQSVTCSQYIKYECERSKLGLHQYTWFKSTILDKSVASIGDAEKFSCPCALTKSCANNENCNCDAMQTTRLKDDGSFTLPHRVGITEMNFLVPNDLSVDASSQITLGPLECVEANTQRYVVTFKTFGSFLEAPGWKSGDLAFSFRTTRSSGILLYQPLLHPQHNAFSVFLANEHELIFRFILNGGHPQKVTVRSKRILSGGEWQQVWIDYDQHQVRFQINAENQMITIPHGQQFGFFEGTIYVGGAPSKYIIDEEVVKDGLIGCFRGLVMNGQVVDLYSYMKFHKADIIKNCTPSCVPNPCQNNAICHENWGFFSCQCENPWAQSGVTCEKDINVDGLTFLSQSSFIKKARQLVDPDDSIQNIMISDIFLNLRTYDSEALVLYANDHLNNFVQIHIEGGAKVVFLWNNGNKINQLQVSVKALNQGKPIQIAVTRNSTHTELYVNSEHASAPVGVYLLHQYSPHPWINPELELFVPPRPFAPVGYYYQLFLGGFENGVLTPKPGNKIPGMLGCLRGLKIGTEVIKIIGSANMNDVLQGCKMVCDTNPCQNGGVCIEDFQARAYSCECIQTSYYGKTCAEERGATFGGESLIRRRFKYTASTVDEVETHFGFFASYAEADTIILTVFIPGPNYSLLFAITKEGHFMIREHREGKYYGALIDYQSFVDGSRHSVYYKRTKSETIFIVDQEELAVVEIDAPTSLPATPVRDSTAGEVYVGGVNEAVPEMSNYKRFKGCISNILIRFSQTPDVELSPIEEFMGYKKKEEDGTLDGEKFDGIKLEACASLTVFRAPLILDNRKNKSEISGETSLEWDAPLPKKSEITGVRRKEELLTGSFWNNFAPYICGIYLLLIILGVLIYAYRINKRYKRRLLEDDYDNDNYFRRQQIHYNVDPKTEMPYKSYKPIDPEKTTLLLNNAPPMPSAPPPVSPPKNNMETSLNNNKKSPNGNPLDNNKTLKTIDDENPIASSSSSNNEKGSTSSSGSNASLNSLNETQALDDKDEDAQVTEPSTFLLTPIEEGANAEKDDDALLPVRLPNSSANPNVVHPDSTTSKSLPQSPSPSICINEHLRTFPSPIQALAGPFYRQLKRPSKDSIISLD